MTNLKKYFIFPNDQSCIQLFIKIKLHVCNFQMTSKSLMKSTLIHQHACDTRSDTALLKTWFNYIYIEHQGLHQILLKLRYIAPQNKLLCREHTNKDPHKAHTGVLDSVGNFFIHHLFGHDPDGTNLGYYMKEFHNLFCISIFYSFLILAS